MGPRAARPLFPFDRDRAANCGEAAANVSVLQGEAGEPHFRELEPAERVAAAARAPSTSSVSARIAPFPRFAAEEDPEHQNGAAIVRVLEGVRAPEGLEQEFAVFLVVSYVNDRDLVGSEVGFVIVQPE